MKFNTLIEVITHFSDKNKCEDYLAEMRWNGSITCVFCNHNKIYQLKRKNRRYKCSNCQKQFSVIKGTIFENSPLSLQKWFTALYLISAHRKGISSVQLASDLGVTQKTAWFMLQRIRFALKTKNFDAKMDGVIQCDESYFGGKNKYRHHDKKVANSQGRSLKTKTPVFGVMHNTGQVRTIVIPDTKAKTIKPIIETMVSEGSIIVTDEWKAYKNLPAKYQHIEIKHAEEEYVRGAFHTNTIEGFWGLFKRGIYGIYHQVSPKHLHRYCDEFSYRYNNRNLTDIDRFVFTLQKVNCRLTYNELIE